LATRCFETIIISVFGVFSPESLGKEFISVQKVLEKFLALNEQ
jgi:hypothetical protein